MHPPHPTQAPLMEGVLPSATLIIQHPAQFTTLEEYSLDVEV